MSADFVHLHLHSEYSLSDSVVRIPELLAAVRRAGMPAMAVRSRSSRRCLREACSATGRSPKRALECIVRRGRTAGRVRYLRVGTKSTKICQRIAAKCCGNCNVM